MPAHHAPFLDAPNDRSFKLESGIRVEKSDEGHKLVCRHVLGSMEKSSFARFLQLLSCSLGMKAEELSNSLSLFEHAAKGGRWRRFARLNSAICKLFVGEFSNYLLAAQHRVRSTLSQQIVKDLFDCLGAVKELEDVVPGMVNIERILEFRRRLSQQMTMRG